MGIEMKCLNCGAECKGEYCPKCGQKTSTQRFQVKEIIVKTIASLIGGDNKLWGTCVGLLTRPGYMVREYLLGKRVCYYNPVSLLVCLVAIYAIATYFFTDALSPFDIVRPDVQTDSLNSSSAEKFLSYYQMMLGNNVYFAIFTVLLSILPYRYVFRKEKLKRPTKEEDAMNVAEHFIALTYQTCFNIILAFLLIPLSVIEDCKTWVARICFVMPTVFCIILYKQMLQITWGKSIWLNIFGLILSFLFNLTILLVIIGFLYGIDNITN